jgi:pilus assembly protein CpaE
VSQRHSFAVLSSSVETGDAIAAALDATDVIRVVARVCEREALESVLGNHPGVGLYVDLESEPEKQLDWLEALQEPRPALLLGGPADPELILRGMRLGALRFFPNHELDPQLERLFSFPVAALPSAAPGKAGKRVAVLGAKGGVGTTTVACELACQLQAHGGRVAVVDAKLHFGDVALHFDAQPSHTLSDVAQQGEALDASFLETVAHLHESGVSLLAAPIQVEDADAVEPHHVVGAVGLLSEAFDWVVVDLPRVTDEVSLQVLDLADQILLVTTLDIPSLARARQTLDLLARLGYGAEQVRLVVNRHGKPGALSDGDPLETLAMQAQAYIPNDDRNVSAALEQGKTLCELNAGSPGAKGLTELAARLHEWCGVALGEPRRSGGILAGALERLRRLRCR